MSGTKSFVTRYPERRQVPSMDLLLGTDSEDVKILYERWRTTWPVPAVARGGIQMITAAMLLEVDPNQLQRTYGKLRAERYLDAAKKVSIDY